MKKIKLTRGKYALVDDDDYKLLINRKWYCNDNGYAAREQRKNGNRYQQYMHREIIGAEKGQEVDHINRNRLDNRKENLRFCTRPENVMNSKKRIDNNSGYRGVFWRTRERKWVSRITINKKRIYTGSFDNKIEAAIAYNNSALKHFGQFALLNTIKINDMKATIDEILKAITVLKLLKDNAEDRPVKSEEYKLYEQTINALCKKLQEVEVSIT